MQKNKVNCIEGEVRGDVLRRGGLLITIRQLHSGVHGGGDGE